MARQVPLLHFALYSLIISAKSPCSAVKSSKSTKKIQLKFDEDGYFKIVQLADLHYGHFPETDQHTDKVGTWSNAQKKPIGCESRFATRNQLSTSSRSFS
jgi:hypothetical protein